jgi:hypothetical protein
MKYTVGLEIEVEAPEDATYDDVPRLVREQAPVAGLRIISIATNPSLGPPTNGEEEREQVVATDFREVQGVAQIWQERLEESPDKLTFTVSRPAMELMSRFALAAEVKE